MESQNEPLFPQPGNDDPDPATWPGLPKRRLVIDWETLCQAIELDALHKLYYLDTQSGETVLVTEESFAFLEETGTYAAAAGLSRSEIVNAREIAADATGRYLEIESRGSRENHRDMTDFRGTVMDTALQEALGTALDDSNPFPRFRDVLADHPAEQARWYGFRRRRLEGYARQWLASQGIEPLNPLPHSENQEPTAGEATDHPEPASELAGMTPSGEAMHDLVLRLLSQAAADGATDLDGLYRRVSHGLNELEQRGWVDGLGDGLPELTTEGRRRLADLEKPIRTED